ncbi:crotonase/enoyl-CoA hydratase family protein [Chenggangzhangella methanolivorans]|uniref:Crotonase/enoyl-CoA hydratase family protein n=2 Tax=Chenggangzhangella methanolivorans TaxID=1437009 RepID=A0A9E6RCD6_9HYPH|nr:crotonase/enoyl-CoA hydratase family protein [Chenggangzhangella methanolivorans]
MRLSEARRRLQAAFAPPARRAEADAETTAGERLALETYAEIEIEHDAALETSWCWMNPIGAPSFTPGLLRDLSAHQRLIREAFDTASADAPAPIKHAVFASRLPGIYNLGGDLGLFAGWIRNRDREGLATYARACIDVLHENQIAFDKPVITVALVQGDALGGGFEAALSCDVIVAERGSKFGLPEILFNLFPGMGAYSLLARRLGGAQAERFIASGKLYTAEELHALGLVQVLAEPGQGVAETHRLLTRNQRRHNGLSALFRAGRRAAPIPYQELLDITEIWVDAALNLEEQDLRKMERLTSAQDKRLIASSVMSDDVRRAAGAL